MKIVCLDSHSLLLKDLMQQVEAVIPQVIGDILPQEAEEPVEIYGFERIESAVTFVKNNNCQILFSEIDLDGRDGIRAVQKMKESNPRLNIIFATVCDEREHAKEVIQLKVSGYLTKPVIEEQLQKELLELRYPFGEVI